MSSNTSSVLKVFKINLLALLAFPLFLISIASKLIVKAMEKFMVFLGVGFAILGLYIFSFIIKNFGGFVEGLLTVIILLFLFGSLVALFIFAPFILGSILAYIFGMVVLVVSTVLNVIFEICHQAYSKLFDVCKSDYEVLSDNNQSKYPTYACVFWHFLRGFNYIIIKLFLFVGTLSIVAMLTT
jgi:hypothetical protein